MRGGAYQLTEGREFLCLDKLLLQQLDLLLQVLLADGFLLI